MPRAAQTKKEIVFFLRNCPDQLLEFVLVPEKLLKFEPEGQEFA